MAGDGEGGRGGGGFLAHPVYTCHCYVLIVLLIGQLNSDVMLIKTQERNGPRFYFNQVAVFAVKVFFLSCFGHKNLMLKLYFVCFVK